MKKLHFLSKELYMHILYFIKNHYQILNFMNIGDILQKKSIFKIKLAFK